MLVVQTRDAYLSAQTLSISKRQDRLQRMFPLASCLTTKLQFLHSPSKSAVMLLPDASTRYQTVWFAAAPGGPAVVLNQGKDKHVLITNAAPEDAELCQLQDMRCLPSVYRARTLQLAEVALVLFS